jgi:endogenous inhibitor of DNA gyrase (YacG/DUF329 family)
MAASALSKVPMSSAIRTVKCPQCGAPVEWSPASRWRPFCSQRCKMIDLGAWASESYRIPVTEAPDGGAISDGPDSDAADDTRKR